MQSAKAATTSGWQRYFDDPRAMNMPWVESPFFEHLLEKSALSPHERELARRFHEDGYVILENVVDDATIDAVVAEYPRLFDPKEAFAEANPYMREILKRDPTRKQDAYYVSKPVKALACDERILRLLRIFYGRGPIPFQTLNFLPGTQQPLHSDAIHFYSMPAKFMCGVWVALEDATLDNGPLQYVPGSHRFSEVALESLGLWCEDNQQKLSTQYAEYERYIEALVKMHNLPVHTATIKKGSALVWAANLIHGGSAIKKAGTTRKSQVTHYFFEDCVYYTPIYSNVPLGEIFLRDVRDIRTGERVTHKLNGIELATALYRSGRSQMWRRGTISRVQRWARKYLSRI